MSADLDTTRRFGVVMFDDDKEPGVGWACVAGDKNPTRIGGPEDLSTGVIWWSNISYDFFYKRNDIWRKTWLRHDKYLVVSHKNALNEWDYDPKVVGPDYTCLILATLFDRVMRMAYGLIREVDPRITMERAFVGKTLRDDLRIVLPEAEYPKSEAASIMKTGQAWEEFTATSVRTVRGSSLIMLRKPRILYTLEMLQTPVPHGPFEHYSKSQLRNLSPDRIAYVRDNQQPCMVEVSVERISPEISPVYGFGNATDQSKKVARSWVSHPEFKVLDRIAEIDVRSVWMGREYGSLMSELPDPVREFLADKYNDNSWSAGIVAETIWRAATLAEEKWKSGPLKPDEDRAQTSWQGAWIKGADKNSMFFTALELSKMDYAVTSYGLGWVMCSVPEEAMNALIRDGLSLGLLPNVIDIPESMADPQIHIQWGGDKRSHSYAHFLVSKKRDLLWNLDRVPMLKEEKRKAFIANLLAKSKQGLI